MAMVLGYGPPRNDIAGGIAKGFEMALAARRLGLESKKQAADLDFREKQLLEQKRQFELTLAQTTLTDSQRATIEARNATVNEELAKFTGERTRADIGFEGRKTALAEQLGASDIATQKGQLNLSTDVALANALNVNPQGVQATMEERPGAFGTKPSPKAFNENAANQVLSQIFGAPTVNFKDLGRKLNVRGDNVIRSTISYGQGFNDGQKKLANDFVQQGEHAKLNAMVQEQAAEKEVEKGRKMVSDVESTLKLAANSGWTSKQYNDYYTNLMSSGNPYDVALGTQLQKTPYNEDSKYAGNAENAAIMHYINSLSPDKRLEVEKMWFESKTKGGLDIAAATTLAMSLQIKLVEMIGDPLINTAEYTNERNPFSVVTGKPLNDPTAIADFTRKLLEINKDSDVQNPQDWEQLKAGMRKAGDLFKAFFGWRTEEKAKPAPAKATTEFWPSKSQETEKTQLKTQENISMGIQGFFPASQRTVSTLPEPSIESAPDKRLVPYWSKLSDEEKRFALAGLKNGFSINEVMQAIKLRNKK